MATTHKLSPEAIAKRVVADNPAYLNAELTDDAVAREVLESVSMLAIAAYTDASNQRPENLSEVCRRLGANLIWVDRRHLAANYELYVDGKEASYAVTDLDAAHLVESMYDCLTAVFDADLLGNLPIITVKAAG